MQDNQYAAALSQSPVCIFKVWLKPYSLRHEGMFLSEGNAFLTHSPVDFDQLPIEQKIFALDRATAICSNAYLQRFPRWHGWKLTRARGRFGIEELDDQCDQFFQYLNRSRVAPRLSRRNVKTGEDAGRAFGAPLLAQLLPFVLTLPEIQKLKTGQEMVDAAWDYPFGAALWRFYTKLEMEGCIQIENDDEEQSRIKRDAIRNEYGDACAAWSAAFNEDERKLALQKFPKLRTYAATEASVREFEQGGVK